MYSVQFAFYITDKVSKVRWPREMNGWIGGGIDDRILLYLLRLCFFLVLIMTYVPT